MRTFVAATCLLGIGSTALLSSSASAQLRPVSPDSASRDSVHSRGLRWQLAPLVDGARSVVVPVLPPQPVRFRAESVAAAPAPVEYMIRIIVPDTTRLAPMPVIRPTQRP